MGWGGGGSGMRMREWGGRAVGWGWVGHRGDEWGIAGPREGQVHVQWKEQVGVLGGV